MGSGSYVVANPSVTLSLTEGDAFVCTFTNEQQSGYLTLLKTVVNDDGGVLTASSFPALINSTLVDWGTTYELDAGTYTASETPQSGYTPSVWGGDCAADGTVYVGPGESKTCTITNDDVAPTLKLVKYVTKDDGGTAVADDWT